MREEFEALGAPAYERRGAVADEYVRALKELWTSDTPAFAGEYVGFSDVIFEPKPVQRPHPPIWIGGESGPALRRAARLGDGWYPIGSNPRHPVGTIRQLSEYVSRLRRFATEAGRDPMAIEVAWSVAWYDDTGEAFLPNGERAYPDRGSSANRRGRSQARRLGRRLSHARLRSAGPGCQVGAHGAICHCG